MPAAKPPEFRRRAVDLARSGQDPVARVASDLGISESCLRRWMARDVDTGRREGLTSDERRELVDLRRRNRAVEMELEILKRASAYFARGNVLRRMSFRLVRELAADGISVAVAYRVLRVSRSGFYDCRPVRRPRGRWPTPSSPPRSWRSTRCRGVRMAHRGSMPSSGWAWGIACGRKRVARLMREAQVTGICHRRKRGRHHPAPAPHEDLVQGRFVAEGPEPVAVPRARHDRARRPRTPVHLLGRQFRETVARRRGHVGVGHIDVARIAFRVS